MAERGKPVKLGLIGCGQVTETRHLPALQLLPNAEVVAVADINPDRLKRVADRFHIEHRYSDFRALLDVPAIEAVAVCVPPQFHAEVALAALDAGKHLLIEKPLTLCLDQSDELIERAARSPRKVTVGFNLRWHRLVRHAREIIRGGILGPLKSVRTVLTSGRRYQETGSDWRKRRELGGGVLFEVAIHHFDLWRFLLQSEVEEVFATSRSEEWDDETATVMARMTNGVPAVSMFSWGTGDSNEVEIYGQAGRLHVSCYRFDGLELVSTSSSPGGIRTWLRRMTHVLRELPQAAWNARHGGDYAASYRAEWQHFVGSIQRDTPVECTLEDGRRALEVALAAVESASLRQPIRVGLAPRKFRPMASAMPVETHLK